MSRIIENSIGMKFIHIPPGRFLMGSPRSEMGRIDDQTQHEVQISRGFFLGIYPVTQAEYLRVMGVNPSEFVKDSVIGTLGGMLRRVSLFAAPKPQPEEKDLERQRRAFPWNEFPGRTRSSFASASAKWKEENTTFQPRPNGNTPAAPAPRSTRCSPSATR